MAEEAPLQQRAAAASSTAPPNKYTHLASDDDLSVWYNIFRTFDRDGGGDVDLRELGLMFRQLGQQPSEAEMRLLIEEVDADSSGTIDFEEFCNLMLRQSRATRTPTWLAELLHTDLSEDDDARANLPSAARLSDPKFEAAQIIKKRLKAGRRTASEGGGLSSAAAQANSSNDAPEELTHEHLLTCIHHRAGRLHRRT